MVLYYLCLSHSHEDDTVFTATVIKLHNKHLDWTELLSPLVKDSTTHFMSQRLFLRLLFIISHLPLHISHLHRHILDCTSCVHRKKRTVAVYGMFILVYIIYYIQVVILFFKYLIFIVSVFWDLLLCCYYYPLCCCVTCKFLARGINKGTSYALLSTDWFGLLQTPLLSTYKMYHHLKYQDVTHNECNSWTELQS